MNSRVLEEIQEELKVVFQKVSVVKRGDKKKDRGKLYNFDGKIRMWDGSRFQSYVRSNIFKNIYFNRLRKINSEINYIKNEIWKPIAESKTHEISNMGRCRNKKTYEILKGVIDAQGYVHVYIGKKVKSAHILVARAFIPNPKNKRTVDHMDKNPSNNKVDNLRWATNKEQNLNRKTMIKTQKKVWRIDIKTNKRQKYNSLQDALKWLVDNGYSKLKKKIRGHHKLPTYCHGNLCSAIKQKRICCGFKWEYCNELSLEYENEIWFDIPYDIINNKNYQISYNGIIKKPNGEFTKGCISGNYKIILIKNNVKKRYVKYQIHRLMALTFLPNWHNKTDVNHKNRNGYDNKLFNLEWVSKKENTTHAYKTGIKGTIKMKVILPNGTIKNFYSKNDMYRYFNMTKYKTNRYIQNNYQRKLNDGRFKGYQFIKI